MPALTTATAVMPVKSRDQNRVVIAGSIMIPTATSVSSDWKPPTRFSATSPRKATWAGPPNLQELCAVRVKLKQAIFYLERNPKLVLSITSFPYIVNSL